MPINKTRRQISRFRKWLFEVGTRVVEILSATMLIGFAMTMLIEHRRLTEQDIYQNFALSYSAWMWMFTILVGICQLIAATKTSVKSNIASGLILIFSSLIWFFITIRFGLAYPPISTALTTYFVFSVATALAGHEVVTVNKKIEAKEHGDN